MIDKMRDDFETAYSELHEWEDKRPQFEYDESMDLYVQDFVQMAWWAWETATLAERERCALVCDAISIEARKDWKAFYKAHDDGRSDGAAQCEDAIRGSK